MNIQQHIKNWKRAVAGLPHDSWPNPIDAANLAEYREWCKELNAAQGDANKAGYVCSAKGVEKKDKGYVRMWIDVNGCSIGVKYQHATRPQAVTDTSRAAYMTVDFTTVRGRIAQAIMDATVAGKDITRNEIVENTGISVNSVCGRVNELLKGTVGTPGKTWRLMVTGRRKSNITGGGEVENEALRFVEVGAARVSEQARLF